MPLNLHFRKRSTVLLLTSLLAACGGNGAGREHVKVFSPRSYHHLDGRSVMKIGFGSCLDQVKPLTILNAVKAAVPDMFIMVGDNVYGDTHDGELTKMADAYDRQKANFHKLELDFPVEAIWDDHDYGLNDAGEDYPHRDASEQLFFDFWEVPDDDVRRTRPGLYWEQRLQISGKTVQIIYLDTRYFRGKLVPTDEESAEGKERYVPTDDTTQTMLGDTQWKWLRQTLSPSADFRLIVSSIQFLAAGHGWECWRMMPHERTRVTALIDEVGVDKVLFLSGDRHRGGLYRFTTPGGNTIHEITSSPLNATTFPAEENGPFRIGSTYRDLNFGLITIDTTLNTMLVELKAANGENVNSFKIKLGS